MAIKSIRLDLETFNALGIGLPELPLEKHPIQMRSLGRVVVVAGPNGAGKSRLLKLVKSLANTPLTSEVEKTLRDQRAEREFYRSNQEAQIRQITAGETRYASDEERDRNLHNLKRGVAGNVQEIERIDRQLLGAEVLSVLPAGPFSVIDFVPKQPVLVDPSQATDANAKNRAIALSNGGSEQAEANAPAYARLVMRSALNAHRNRSKASRIEASAEEVAEARLLELIRGLLGPSFKIELSDDLNLKMGVGHQYWAELSAGQQVLFQFACMLHAQGSRLADSIVLMDEPENHLHPAVLNEVIDILQRTLGVGQVWIATHSVPLIAHLLASEPDCLWYAEDGRFERAGRTPARVLEGLMGGAKGAADLQALTLLPAEYATLRFLAECLVEPGVVGPDVDDPQTKQIAEIITAKSRSQGRCLRVVDFGAGVGRLLTTLVSRFEGRPVSESIDYLALEPDGAKHKELLQELEAAYGPEASNRIFSDEHKLGTRIDTGSVDGIVMCNVLHEINPDDWTTLFNSKGPLMQALADDGFVLIVEDYGIPVGERAHRYGFLLLDEPELRRLFAVSENDAAQKHFVRVSSTQDKYRDRLVAHLVAKCCVTRISAKTRMQSIESLRDRMGSLVGRYLEAPEEKVGSTSGRDYARAAQLYTNSSIWLRKHAEQ